MAAAFLILCMSLYSEPSNASFPMTSAVQSPTYTTSGVTSSTLTSSALSPTSPVTASSSYDQSSVHTRIACQSPASPPDSAPGSAAVSGVSFPRRSSFKVSLQFGKLRLTSALFVAVCVLGFLCFHLHCIHVEARGQLTEQLIYNSLFYVYQVSNSGR